MNTHNLLPLVLFVSVTPLLNAQIASVNIFSDKVSFFNGATAVTTGVFDVRWGTFTGSTFVPFYGAVASTSNDGYIGNPFGDFELFSTLNASDNSVAIAGTQMYLAVTILPDNTNYISSINEAVLTDTSWIVPTLTLVGNPLDLFLTANTVAVKGFFNFNPTLSTITAIPEPSSFAAFAGLAVLGLVGSRRRRSA